MAPSIWIGLQASQAQGVLGSHSCGSKLLAAEGSKKHRIISPSCSPYTVHYGRSRTTSSQGAWHRYKTWLYTYCTPDVYPHHNNSLDIVDSGALARQVRVEGYAWTSRRCWLCSVLCARLATTRALTLSLVHTRGSSPPPFSFWRQSRQ